MRKPDKPTNKLPESFGGIKENFSQDKISYGYQPDVPDILGGANLNYLLDTDGDNNRYFNAICDFITDMPIAKTITVNDNNELVYRDWLGGRNFGELVYSSIPLSDSGLKLLDGSLIQGSGIYKNFVDYIATIVNTYPSLFTTEENWQAIVSQYKVCGKYVYDSTNNTVRIPKVTGIVEGTVDVNALGNIVAAGLPLLTTNTGGNHTHSGTTGTGTPHSHTRGTMNITGTYPTGSGSQPESFTGSFYWVGEGPVPGEGGGGGQDDKGGFDASRSWTGSTSVESSHTHNYNISSSGSHNHTVNWGATTNTVQPQTVKMFVYVVVATGVNKTDIELDIDDIVTDLNYKADLDLSNLSETGEAKFNTKVSKSGDTMSGTLSILKDSYDQLKLTNTNLDIDTIPVGNQHIGTIFCDRIGTQVGDCTFKYKTNGDIETYIRATKNGVNSVISVGIDTNDNPITSAPACDANNSIVTTIAKNKAQNGYYKLGNGLIIQWGTNSVTHGSNTINLPTAFTSTNYIALALPANITNGFGVTSRATTSFNFNATASTTIDWIAIGY